MVNRSQFLVLLCHDDPGQRLPAPELENLVIARLRAFLADPAAIDGALPEDRRDAPMRKRASDAAAELIQILDDPSSTSREPFLRAVLTRVQVRLDGVEIQLDRDRVATALIIDRPEQEKSTSEGSAATSLAGR